MNLYISDLHFGHENVIGFDHRPFADVEEMNQVLMKLWNGRVQKDDDVYILGDFCYRSEYDPSWYLTRLKGKKHLVLGNHDIQILKSEKAMGMFESIEHIQFVDAGEERLILCHYPIADWNGRHRGYYHVYGHIHNRKDNAFAFMRNEERALNAGCMINNYTPASLWELIENNMRFKMG